MEKCQTVIFLTSELDVYVLRSRFSSLQTYPGVLTFERLKKELLK